MKIDFRKLLFENFGLKQTIFKNTFWLATAEGITRFLKLILIIYVARILGATEYGKFAFALALVSLLAVFSDFGLSSIVTRELSRKKEREKEFSAILSLKLLLGLAVLTLVLCGSIFITPDFLIRKVIWILAIYISVSNFSEIVYAFLRARQRMEYEAITKILQAALITGAGFFVILNFPSIENLSFSYLFGGLIASIAILVFFHFKISPLKFSWQKSIWQKFLGMSWPLGLGVIFAVIAASIGPVIMGYLGLITEVGWYSAARKIVNVLVIPSFLISQSFFPVLSSAFKESREALQRVWDYQMEIRIFIAIPLMVGGIIFAPRIIDLIYGQSFSPSIFAFQVLIIGAGLLYLNSVFAQALIISNQQKKTLWIGFLGAIINTLLNLFLIPRLGLYGVVLSAPITFFFSFLLLFGFTLQFTSVRPLNSRIFLSFRCAIISSILMHRAISQPKIYHLNIFLSVSIGAGIYLIALFICGRLVKYIFVH